MDRLKAASLSFIRIALVWLIILLLVRVFEVVWNGFRHEFPSGLPGFLLQSFAADLVFWFKWLVIEYVVFLLLFLIKPKIAETAFKVFIVLITIVYIGLIQYFSTSLVPLGADLYSYSLEDIKQTLGASGGVSIMSVLGFILAVLIVLALLKLLPKRIKLPLWFTFALPGLSLFFFLINAYQLVRFKAYASEFSNNLLLNKVDYFFGSSYDYVYPEDTEVDIYSDAYIGDFDDGPALDTASYKYVGGKEYPFLRDLKTPDVLSPFFNKSASKPNVVIILIEGLGRAFSNEGAYLGNFTPFIDSLSSKSLYWKNFLSAGGRTFAVLPSVMASLPFATNGFLELGARMPDHLSLYNLLENSGYHTSFYYGGNADFDNMSLFLKKNSVNEVIDMKSFPVGSEKLPAVNGFTWGYSDKDLFGHYLNTRKDDGTKSPNLSVLLTVASHNPFLIKNQEKYLERFEQRMDELAFETSKKEKYRNYKLQYSSIMYADEALKEFFKAYEKRADFKNTIFLITGDHRLPEIPMISKIDRYHVPFMIYSPLLKRTAQFASISTHFDITPSLLAYLGTNYGVKTPGNGSWIGEGLDTARSFRNIHQFPLIQTKTDIVDFVMNEYHLNGTVLYELGSNLEEQPVTDEAIYSRVKNAFENFKRRNSEVAKGSKILPDSLIKRYIR